MTSYRVYWVTRGMFEVEADTEEQARELADGQVFVEAALNGGWGAEVEKVDEQ